MRKSLPFLVAFILVTPSQSHETETICGELCGDFVHMNGDLGILSAKNRAEIWNTTSGECLVTMISSLNPVSYSSLITTFGVTPAIRRNIGKDCWDYSPETVSMWILRKFDGFDKEAICHTYPTNSPSLGWEMRYEMEVTGFNDCSSLVTLHENSIGECVRHLADARAFATFCYMIVVFIALVICCFLGLLCCGN